ncbi:MAG: ABC transporter ATP-binding protein, partial [Paenibacillus sp.]
MSREQTEKKRGFGGPRRGHGGPGGPGMGMPVEKAKDFKGTLKRLIRYLRPHKVQLAAVLVMAILSTVFSIFSPKVMGKATTKLFEGIVAKIQGVPGAEIDFQYVWQIIMILIGLYVLSALFGYVQQYLMAGVAQKTVYDLRKDVNAKLNKLPLKYFDARTHGEILSRVTNDVDNIAGTLQQSLTQLITSILTIIGVIAMMLSISPLMTLIAVLTLPLSIVAITSIAKRSQKQFV